VKTSKKHTTEAHTHGDTNLKLYLDTGTDSWLTVNRWASLLGMGCEQAGQRAGGRASTGSTVGETCYQHVQASTQRMPRSACVHVHEC
jgi:hypothetical protein